MDDRRAEREVKQRRQAHAVEEEAGVAGVGPADRVERQRPDHLGDAGQRLDHPERLAQRARRAQSTSSAASVSPGAVLGARDHGLVALADQARVQPHQPARPWRPRSAGTSVGSKPGAWICRRCRPGRGLELEAAVLVGLARRRRRPAAAMAAATGSRPPRASTRPRTVTLAARRRPGPRRALPARAGAAAGGVAGGAGVADRRGTTAARASAAAPASAPTA